MDTNYDTTHRIDCPIDWCAGYLADHGGLGDAPEVWLHGAEAVTLGDGIMLYENQLGAGTIYYELFLGDESIRADSAVALAEQLRTLAALIEARS